MFFHAIPALLTHACGTSVTVHPKVLVFLYAQQEAVGMFLGPVDNRQLGT